MREALPQERRRIHNHSGTAGDADFRPPRNTTPYVCILEMEVALPAAEEDSQPPAKRDPMPLMAARRGDQAQGLQDALQPRSDWTHPSQNPARPALPLSSLFVFVAFPDLSRTPVETMEEVGHADSASFAQ